MIELSIQILLGAVVFYSAVYVINWVRGYWQDMRSDDVE